MVLPDGVVRICIHSSSSVFMSTTEPEAMVVVVGCCAGELDIVANQR